MKQVCSGRPQHSGKLTVIQLIMDWRQAGRSESLALKVISANLNLMRFLVGR